MYVFVDKLMPLETAFEVNEIIITSVLKRQKFYLCHDEKKITKWMSERLTFFNGSSWSVLSLTRKWAYVYKIIILKYICININVVTKTYVL